MTTDDIAALVSRIVAFNDVWHALRDLSADADPDEPRLASLRDIKSALQARLLRDSDGFAFLRLDENAALAEPCYSVRLRQKASGRSDACHLPVRLARQIFTERELSSLVEVPDA